MKPILVKPSEKYLKSYIDACIELKNAGFENHGWMNDPDELSKWKDELFVRFDNNLKGINLPDGYVPCTTYWLVDGDEYIGSGNIRHWLTDGLKEFDGHIGYGIRPSRWNMGYGTIQLKLLLEKAYELGIKEALLTCDVNNPGSYRVMEKNDGVRQRKYTIQIDGKDRESYSYLIKTNKLKI